MELSWWEIDSWFSNVDYTIIGSGIVGLNAAIRLREKFPDSKILLLERGPLPQGASTKNAGFACFGSLSEIVDDLQKHSSEEVVALIRKRWDGLQFMRKTLGDEAINFENLGGWELFSDDGQLAAPCIAQMTEVNILLRPIFHEDVFSIRSNGFGFEKISDKLIFNPFESQIDTGKMMQALLRKAIAEKILILNNQEVQSFDEVTDGVWVNLPSIRFKTSKLLIANNGFAAKFTGEDVRPARAQVVITKPIPGLKVKGTFHFDQGY
ncbi:MAG: FAD-binding oxidoreductase, partial [Flavobacterium sp.]